MNHPITADSALLAEFLGWEICHCGMSKEPHYKCGEKNWEVVDVGEMKFHKDWNWLMLVVDKIEKMPSARMTMERGKIRIHYALTDSPGHPIRKKTFKCHTISKISATYRCVVEFIIWYNHNKIKQ